MKKNLIAAIWTALLYYCDRINKVALNPNKFDSVDGQAQCIKYTEKINDLDYVIKLAEGTITIYYGEESQHDDGTYFEPIQAIELRIGNTHNKRDFFSEW